MNSKSGGLINTLIVWGIASAVGWFAMAALMIIGDWGIMQGLFAAAVIFFGLGALMSVLFLRPLPGPVQQGQTGISSDAAERAAPAAAAASAPAASPAPAPAAAPAPAPAPEAAPAADSGPGTRPASLDAPRGGAADDLKKIKGVGPKLEKLLHSMGFYHFDQVAAWTSDEVAWVDENLEGFKGRVTRDDWVSQAKLLAAGGETDFSRKVGDGDVY